MASMIYFDFVGIIVLERGPRGSDRMVVEFTTTCAIMPITTNVLSSNPVLGDVYSLHYYAIKFVSDLRQVVGFLRVLRFPPLIKLSATILLKYC